MKNVGVPMSELIDVLKYGGELVKKILTRASERDEKRWRQILETLKYTQELTKTHLEALNLIVKPILLNDDVIASIDNFQLYILESDFSRGYKKTLGIIQQAQMEKKFQEDQQILAKMYTEIVKFEFASYMLEYDSWTQGEHLKNVKKLWTYYSNPNEIPPNTDLPKLREDVTLGFKHFFEWLRGELQYHDRLTPALQNIEFDYDNPKVDSVSELNEMTSQLFKTWIIHVRHTLEHKEDFDFLVGKFEVIANNRKGKFWS